ncbi:LytTR family DNA-binding domain-containing protein [Sporosarcina sp. Te-1]|uniref:LytR/AlgR family response regulator transcription factor n=1 Tax=Sporosarcina sp. Te-1 TaxID=2818390 RepID=UPI001FB1707B|nr:LytTR family transcriptional regulator DNA-binding domain-containing protein [Sporosarcina sp. Te-1]
MYIVEDEPLARDELRFLLNKYDFVEVVGESENAQDALKEITELQPNLIFLDIELTDGNSLSLAKELQTALSAHAAIVFATAYDEYALTAFDLNAADYILKPIAESRLDKTLEKVRAMHGRRKEKESQMTRKESSPKVVIPVEERIILLEPERILYVESNGGKCIIVTSEQRFEVKDSLVNMEKKLSDLNFIRVHRSFIVNTHHICEIHPWFNATYNLVMKDNSRVPVSRSFVRDLKQLFEF